MKKVKVTYFDVDGGRGEPIRVALHAAGIAFEDERFNFAQFPEVRKRTPFGQVPVVEVDGQQLTQSNALLRYFGRQAALYPDDPWQAYLCDEAMDVIEDVTYKLTGTFGLEGDALKQAREALAAGPIAQVLGWLSARLSLLDTGYLAGGRLSVADLKVFYFTGWIASGMLDHIAPELVTSQPVLADHIKRVETAPQVRAYYEGRAQ